MLFAGSSSNNLATNNYYKNKLQTLHFLLQTYNKKLQYASKMIFIIKIYVEISIKISTLNSRNEIKFLYKNIKNISAFS